MTSILTGLKKNTSRQVEFSWLNCTCLCSKKIEKHKRYKWLVSFFSLCLLLVYLPLPSHLFLCHFAIPSLSLSLPSLSSLCGMKKTLGRKEDISDIMRSYKEKPEIFYKPFISHARFFCYNFKTSVKLKKILMHKGLYCATSGMICLFPLELQFIHQAKNIEVNCPKAKEQ